MYHGLLRKSVTAGKRLLDFLRIEDHGSNAGLAAEKVRRIIDNLCYMTGIERMHGVWENYEIKNMKETG